MLLKCRQYASGLWYLCGVINFLIIHSKFKQNGKNSFLLGGKA